MGNPNYHKNPSDNPWRQVEPYLDVAQRIKSPLEHYRPSPWEQNFGTNYIRSVVIALGLWTCFWAHHSYNDILEETKKERKQYFAKMGRRFGRSSNIGKCWQRQTRNPHGSSL